MFNVESPALPVDCGSGCWQPGRLIQGRGHWGRFELMGTRQSLICSGRSLPKVQSGMQPVPVTDRLPERRFFGSMRVHFLARIVGGLLLIDFPDSSGTEPITVAGHQEAWKQKGNRPRQQGIGCSQIVRPAIGLDEIHDSRYAWVVRGTNPS